MTIAIYTITVQVYARFDAHVNIWGGKHEFKKLSLAILVFQVGVLKMISPYDPKRLLHFYVNN